MVRPAFDLAQLVALPPAERLALVQALWDSLRADPDALPLSAGDLAVVAERQAEHRQDPAGALDWAAVRAELWAEQGADEQAADEPARGE